MLSVSLTWAGSKSLWPKPCEFFIGSWHQWDTEGSEKQLSDGLYPGESPSDISELSTASVVRKAWLSKPQQSLCRSTSMQALPADGAIKFCFTN